MTNKELCDRARQWLGPPLSDEEETELEALEEAAMTMLTEEEYDAAETESVFPLEVLDLPADVMASATEGASGIVGFPNTRVFMESLRRRLAAKQES